MRTRWTTSDSHPPDFRDGRRVGEARGGTAGKRRKRHVHVSSVDDGLPARKRHAGAGWPPRLLRDVLPRHLVQPALRGESDHLDPGAPRDVHRLDHFLIDPVRRRLHEQQLGRPLVEDGVDLGVQLVLGKRLPVDVVGAVRGDLQDDLAWRAPLADWSPAGAPARRSPCGSAAARS